jgi:hypothetical protein
MRRICIIAGTALSGFRCAPEFLWGDAKLFQYFVVQRRSNFAPAVYGNCHGGSQDEFSARDCPFGAPSQNRVVSPPGGTLPPAH